MHQGYTERVWHHRVGDTISWMMLVRPSTYRLGRVLLHKTGSRRSFFSVPTSTPQKYTVCRTLPHARADLFDLIRDIDAYAGFVPFCTASKVTRRDDAGWPVSADLTVGFKQYEESFSSRVRCLTGGSSGSSVEAVANNHPLFERLVTAWRIEVPKDAREVEGKVEEDTRPGEQRSLVHLDIEYQFANPVYGALSQAVLPKVADQIIQAFEKHAEQVLATKK